MSRADDPTFPYRYQEMPGDPVIHYHGLTKREYAAIQAMQGMLAKGSRYVGLEDCENYLVADAIAHADALLARLEQTEE